MSVMPRSSLSLLLLLGSGVFLLGIAIWRASSGLSPDSVTYLDVATSVLQGQGLSHRWAYWDPVYETYALPTKTTLWPPGYSLAIAGVASLGIESVFAARLISLLCCTGLFVAFFLLLRYFLPWALSALGALCLAILFPLIPFFAAVSTEPGYLFLATLSVLFTVSALTRDVNSNASFYWLAASIAAAGAFLFRYVGLSCVMGVTLLSCWAAWRGTSNRRWLYPVLASVPSGLIVAGVLARNYLTAHTPGRPYAGADVFWATLPGSCKAVITELIGSADLLGPLPFRVLSVVQLGSLFVLSLGAFWSFRGVRTEPLQESDGPTARTVSGVILLFLGLYIFLVVGACFGSGVDIESRYLTVILPWPLLILIGWALRGARSGNAEAECLTGFAKGALIACVLFLLCQGVLAGRWLLNGSSESYVSLAKESPTIAWLKKNVSEREVLVTTRGADIAQWCPNPVLRLPRIPYSAVQVTSWDTVDQIADKAHAQLLVHFIGYPSISKWDPEQSYFLRSMDVPDKFVDRRPIVFTDGIIYQVGTKRTLEGK